RLLGRGLALNPCLDLRGVVLTRPLLTAHVVETAPGLFQVAEVLEEPLDGLGPEAVQAVDDHPVEPTRPGVLHEDGDSGADGVFISGSPVVFVHVLLGDLDAIALFKGMNTLNLSQRVLAVVRDPQIRAPGPSKIKRHCLAPLGSSLWPSDRRATTV